MSYPTDTPGAPSAGLDVARSRADTGASLSAAPYGSSYRSTNGSSVVPNGSLLDLYARSPGSVPGSMDPPVHIDAGFHLSAAGSPSAAAQTSSAPIGDHWNTATRGFQAPSRDHESSTADYSMPPSDSNASIWTTASAAATETQDEYKRASMAGFDADVMRSVQAAHPSTTFDSIREQLPRPPPIGLETLADDSDGSYYGDEPLSETSNHESFDRSDNTVEAAVPQQNANRHASSRQASLADADVGNDAAANMLPSPPVPRRTSSVAQDTSAISPSTSQMEDMASLARDPHAGSRSSSGHLTGGQIPQRRSSSEYREEPVRRHLSRDARPPRESSPVTTASNDSALSNKHSGSPTKGTALLPVDEIARKSSERPETISRTSHEPSLDEQKRLEKELLAEADESRPRTLKEARERAKMRRQQSEPISLPSAPPTTASTTSPRKNNSLYVRDVASSATAAAAQDDRPSSGLDVRDRPLRNPKRLSSREDADNRSVGERSAPSDYSHDSDAEGAFTLDEMSSRPSQRDIPVDMSRSTSNMAELTDAVDDAMNSLNFGDADETLSADDEHATPMPLKKEGDRPPIETSLPSARSSASITGSAPNVLQEAIRSSPMSSPAKHTPLTPKASATTGSYFTPAISTQSIATPPLGSPVSQRIAQAPSAAQQSGPAPLPKRLDIYGRTLPLPKAFASSTIIRDKKLKPSWDRARTYAQFTNELLRLDTNLNIWMEVVQRPAMRQQKRSTQQEDWLAQGTLPRSKHVRDEGSYADSIRSDMTFPMRGDGARAKEIVNVMPTMEESPTRTSVSLPYPGVMAQQQPRSNSMQSVTSASGGALAMGSSDSLSRGSGTASGNRFFSGLGRKGSKRAQSRALASAASASMSSLAAGVGGSRAYLANSRSKLASQPNLLGTVGSQPSTETVETSFSSNSRPESPATGAPRVMGLGLGGSATDTSATQARLDTVQEASGLSSSTTTKAPRAPLGPRAPNVGALTRSSTEMKRTKSGHSQPTTPITPITTITPTTPSAAERGMSSTTGGATSVSRLGGGGSSFSSLGGTNSSREGYISPDYLGSRRPSDVSGTSPTSPHLRTSLSYTSVRDRMRRGSSPGPDDEAFNEALRKLGDILPEADEATLRYYLKKAKGNDLTAIGDYLQDQSLGKSPKF